MTRTLWNPLPYMAVLFMTFALLSVAELAYWNGKPGAGYPISFTEGAPAADVKSIEELRAHCGQPLELKARGPDQVMVRCGAWWPTRNVWVVDRSFVGGMAPEPERVVASPGRGE